MGLEIGMEPDRAADETGGWNFARVWEDLASVVPDRVAVVGAERRLTFAELDRRAERLAAVFAGAGLRRGDRVAINLYNSPEYVETFFAAAKLGCVPTNVNYRYTGHEVAYVLDNADARAVVFHADFAPVVEAALGQLDDRPALLALQVDGSGAETGPWAVSYEAALAGADEDRPILPRPLGDDLIFLYTGGTTGMPKGVMWRHEDLYLALWELSRPGKEPRDPAAEATAGKRAMTALPASPLIHGTALFICLQTLAGAGTVVLLDGRGFDPIATLETVQREEVQLLSIVGDAFARPLLGVLDARSGEFPCPSLKAIVSSGVLWSPETKQRLLAHLPDVRLIDSLGASEGPITRSITTSDQAEIPRATFSMNESMRVLDDDGLDVEPGSGRTGRLAKAGPGPIGYHKDPERSAQTFRVIDGVRYTVAGDFATVQADGTIAFLGRGSGCINTGGEKVFAEEVEAVLRGHPAVFDCAVVGTPDDRWGERVVAVVQLTSEVSPEELNGFCADRLAAYKRPKDYVVQPDLDRDPAGKVDHQRLQRLVAETLADSRRSGT